MRLKCKNNRREVNKGILFFKDMQTELLPLSIGEIYEVEFIGPSKYDEEKIMFMGDQGLEIYEMDSDDIKKFINHVFERVKER